MCHKLPPPLSRRVFPELVLTAKTGPLAFIVVQIPVNLESFPEALYSNGRNIKEGDGEIKRKSLVQGYVMFPSLILVHAQEVDLMLLYRVYTSIERCRVDEDQNIVWAMATTSDAKGSLPMWAQKLGVPGAIVKDVGRLMRWISQRRNSLAASN